MEKCGQTAAWQPFRRFEPCPFPMIRALVHAKGAAAVPLIRVRRRRKMRPCHCMSLPLGLGGGLLIAATFSSCLLGQDIIMIFGSCNGSTIVLACPLCALSFQASRMRTYSGCCTLSRDVRSILGWSSLRMSIIFIAGRLFCYPYGQSNRVLKD